MRTLGIVGGGRWAQIIDRVANKNEYTTQFYTHNNQIGSVDNLLSLDSDHVWIANSPDDHYASAVELLSDHRHILVEEPCVRSLEQHDHLVELAKQNDCKLVVGLELEHSNRIQEITDQIDQQPKTINIVWNSENNTERHGELYVSDPTISVLEDIGPHVLTILRKVIKKDSCQVLQTTQTPRGIFWLLDFAGTIVSVDFERNSANKRIITIDDKIYDFAQDDGKSLDRQLAAFANGVVEYNTADNTRWITETICTSVQQLYEQHLDIIRHSPDFDRVQILGLYLSQSIITAGYAHSRYDPQLYQMLEHCLQVIDCYSATPFVTQQTIQQKLLVSQHQLLDINSILRSSDFVQQCIIEDIRNSQYWKNTIIPLMQSGTIQKVLKNEYGYPHRIGLHIGQSCMFWCTFCGRNMDTNASYKKSKLREATPHLLNLINTSPQDDPYRFYLSGGLETRTNPDLMKLISAGHTRGFKFSLYTNGFMLTERFVEANPDLFKLEVLRISLYGSNQDVYTQVTKHKQGFTRVKQNAIDFLKYKKLNNKQLRFGFNYVILPGLEEDLLEVLDLIEEINVASGNQLDFITLRENFREPTDASTFGDRTKLKRIFEQVEQRRKSENLNRLHIDYGYALNALSKGIDAPTMHCITEHNMLPKGFPQVDLVVDAYGLVYLCREAGFLDRDNNDRYIIGQVTEDTTLEQIVNDWITKGKPIDIQPGDTEFMDSYEHIISLIINQSVSDSDFGIDATLGPITAKAHSMNTVSVQAFYQGDSSARIN